MAGVTLIVRSVNARNQATEQRLGMVAYIARRHYGRNRSATTIERTPYLWSSSILRCPDTSPALINDEEAISRTSRPESRMQRMVGTNRPSSASARSRISRVGSVARDSDVPSGRTPRSNVMGTIP